MSIAIAWIAAEAPPPDQGGNFYPFADEPSGEADDRSQDTVFYRARTIALLCRHLRYSLETGRLPCVLGREIFRAAVTSYSAATFEEPRALRPSCRKLFAAARSFLAAGSRRHRAAAARAQRATHLLHCSRSSVNSRPPRRAQQNFPGSGNYSRVSP